MVETIYTLHVRTSDFLKIFINLETLEIRMERYIRARPCRETLYKLIIIYQVHFRH